MTRRIFKTFAATLCIAGMTVPAAAQQQAPADQASQETREHAIQNLQLLFAGLNSETVDENVKQVLMGCIFQNSMRQITEAMDQAIASNPGQIDRSDNNAMLGLMAGVCGLRPEQAQQPQQ